MRRRLSSRSTASQDVGELDADSHDEAGSECAGSRAEPPLAAECSPEALDDDAALEAVASLYRGLRALNASLWGALLERLRIGPRAAVRGRKRSRAVRALEAARSLTSVLDVNTINPAAWVLGPVQLALGRLLHKLAAVERLVTWHDAVTAPLYTAAALLCVLLALIPWQHVVPFCLRWGARLLGALLFGPHMYYVGTLVDSLEAKRKDEAKAEAARPKAVGEGGGGGEAAELELELEAYVLEVESFQSVPRRLCLPDVRCAHSLRPL